MRFSAHGADEILPAHARQRVTQHALRLPGGNALALEASAHAEPRQEEILYSVIPQVPPLWISFSLYRFESNVRSASVVGIAGAGGIGVVLYEVIRSFQYVLTCAVLVILIVFVSVIDLLSARIRAHTI